MIKARTLILLELSKIGSRFVGILVCSSVFLTACGVETRLGLVQNDEGEKSQMYEINDCTLEGSCFFRYPMSATISEQNGVNVINDGGCKVYLGLSEPKADPSYDKKVSENGNVNFSLWFKDDVLVGRIAVLANTNYKFWLYDEENGISSCEYLMGKLIDSFTDKPLYINDGFSFEAAMLPNYRVEYLSGNEGLVMRRTVEGEELKKIVDAEWETWPQGAKGGPDENPYDVVIGITAMDNLLGHKDLGDYLRAECADCTLEFFDDGVFIGEDKINFSERVYLVMSDDKKTLYRAFLRLPRYRFKYHQKGFDEWVKTIELF